jgi:multicomponent Na+:H+ antiporter subunit D
VSQVITVAALARAAWMVFFRAREPYESHESARPGMVAGFAALAGLCVAFGVLPSLLLPKVLDPAAGWLLAPDGYARSVLHGGGETAPPHVSFDYLEPTLLVTIAVTVVLGLALAWRYAGRRSPSFVRPLQVVHTGSVNDYALFLVSGVVAVCAGLAIR